MRRRGNPPVLAKATDSCTGMKSRKSSDRRKVLPNNDAVAKDINIVNVAAAASCHESARLDRVNVEPILATVRAGWKKKMDSRLAMRQLSRLSKADGPKNTRGTGEHCRRVGMLRKQQLQKARGFSRLLGGWI